MKKAGYTEKGTDCALTPLQNGGTRNKALCPWETRHLPFHRVPAQPETQDGEIAHQVREAVTEARVRTVETEAMQALPTKT